MLLIIGLKQFELNNSIQLGRIVQTKEEVNIEVGLYLADALDEEIRNNKNLCKKTYTKKIMFIS